MVCTGPMMPLSAVTIVSGDRSSISAPAVSSVFEAYDQERGLEPPFD